MSDNLNALEDWAGALLAKLQPTERRKLNQTLARELRRSQQQRIAAQQNPDGSAYAPRKPRKNLRRQGRIKMFAKLRQAKHLKLQSDADSIALGITGRAGRIAHTHQHGLTDRPERNGPEIRYARRELLGFTEAELDMIRDRLLHHLAL